MSDGAVLAWQFISIPFYLCSIVDNKHSHKVALQA